VVSELQEPDARLQGAIIAAGRGTRLRTAGDDVPKPLVRLGGETLLARQARAMVAAGAREVLAIVNSETAGIIAREKIELPAELRMTVRDTPNSMETLLALGEFLDDGYFLAATVDAIIPQAEFARFVSNGLLMIEKKSQTEKVTGDTFDGVLGVVKWRGDQHPLFAKVSDDGAIVALGEHQAPLVTAGVYLLHTAVFKFAQPARREKFSALRRFLSMLIDHGMRLGAIELANVIDVDEASDLALARAALEVAR
jgi:NDP-sugar pyrophosphorylase family protein